VQSCTEEVVQLSTGESVPTATFVWSAGVAPSPILQHLPLPRTPLGKLDVDATLAIKGTTGLWAVGDSAAIPDVVTGKTCPPTAQYALRQGRRLAENIAAVIRGQSPREFRHRSQGLLAGLGRRCAVAEVFGFRFSGFVAWWLWRTIYLMKLPGWERKLRVALDWTLDLLFPRDIVYLRPLHAAGGAVVESPPTAEDHRASCPVPGTFLGSEERMEYPAKLPPHPVTVERPSRAHSGRVH
jgi:NADH dehydrogenase